MDTLDAYLKNISQDSDTPLLQRLEAITPLNMMTQKKSIFLQSIEFAGYDFSPDLITVPGEKDDDEAEAKEYANEFVIGSMLSNSWQPNFFRPRV